MPLSALNRDRPEVAVNFAMTWDGRVSTRNRTPAMFSSPLDKRRFLEIRATGDAVLVGRRTLEVDRMTMRLPDAELRRAREAAGRCAEPLRVVVSESGRLDPALPLFSDEDGPPRLLFSTEAMPQPTREALEGRATLHLSPGPQVDLRELLAILWREHGVRRVVCEGGPTLLASLLVAGCVDEVNLTLCPLIFGGAAAPTLTGALEDRFLANTALYRLGKMEEGQGGEWFLQYRRTAPEEAA
ncbi:MAG TPA: dihydrofolate reductase family protein [Chthoniobacteraceae bacterium]|nr:dihydrofolate reductase family protein [Chthoniobacteraceae bacterium]